MNRRKAALDALDIIISQAYVESEEEPDDDSMSDADYEQDVSSSSDGDEPSDAEMGISLTANFVGADGTRWEDQPVMQGRRQAVNVMRAAGGLSAFGRRQCGQTALSNWRAFIDDQFLDTIVECTNEKARSSCSQFVTDRQELSAYIGITLLIGVYKGRGEPVRAIWSKSEGRRCISQFMLLKRFQLLTKYLRFDLTNTRATQRLKTKFAPMGSVFDKWEQKLCRPFIPYEYVTVDETLVPFRGRCSFKQYMPSKPAKYGLKFWSLCDAKTAYCIHMQPYLGTDQGACRNIKLGTSVVLNLTSRLDAGRTVVTDNFFTSFDLLLELRARKLGLVGTIRKNRREIPPEFTAKKSEAGSCIFGFNAYATLVSYAPKKNKRVVLISSEHCEGQTHAQTGKPEIITTYNQGKGGVDHLDKMCSEYTSRKRTLRWPKIVFQHMLDVTAYNSFILWCEVTGSVHVNRRQFIKMLGAELCNGELDEKGDIKLFPDTVAAMPGKRMRCRQCIANKTVQRCKQCAAPLCINCASYNCQNCTV